MKKDTCYLMIGNGIFNQQQALRFADNSMGFKDLTPWIVELHHVISPFSSIVKQGKLASAPHEKQESFGFLWSMAQDSWVKWFDGSFTHQKWWFSGNSMEFMGFSGFFDPKLVISWEFMGLILLSSGCAWLRWLMIGAWKYYYQPWSSIDIEGIMYQSSYL